MKILTVNTFDIDGGAARAAYRLHRSLIKEGIDSQMLVQTKESDDFTILNKSDRFHKATTLLRRIADDAPLKFYNKTQTHFSPAWVPFAQNAKKINEIKPDLVHLHWIGGGMWRIEELAQIKVPIVWSLHDMWPFTGGCHYDEGCEGYLRNCGSCKVLRSNSANDLSSAIFKRKEKTFRDINNLSIVGISKWLAECALNSTLFKDKRVVNIPNPIDTQTFCGIDKSTAKSILGLPRDKKLIMFGAMGATSDPRKGFKQLHGALENLKRDDVELVIFGSGEPKKPEGFKFKTHYLGRFNDDVSLKLLYSAADLMVVPSIQENLSNAIMESLACSTPVVSFNIGGNSDLIDHNSNGYLAKPYDIKDLATGMNWILSSENYKELCLNARRKVEDNFNSKLVTKRYIELYHEVIEAERIKA
jgi:glycosyltransferase involved in cell wall biosynthesis